MVTSDYMNANQPRVLVVCLSPYAGGMELDAIKLAALLASVTRITLLVKAGSFLESEARVRLGRTVEIRSVQFRSRLFSPSIIAAVLSSIRESGAENLIFFGASELKSIAFAVHGRRTNLVVRHGTTKSTPKKDWLHRWVYDHVAHHVALSRHLARNVIEIFPLAAKAKLHVIAPSIEAVKPIIHDENQLEIVHVGRITPGKGQLHAVQACEHLLARGVRFRLRLVGGIGDPAYAERVRAEINASRSPNSFELTGQVRDVGSILAQSDIFLFPSQGEGFGNAFNEALSAGLVALAFDNTAFPELRDQGFYFHLVPDGDVAALGEKLEQIVCNMTTERAAALANRELAVKLYSVEREQREWLSLLGHGAS